MEPINQIKGTITSQAGDQTEGLIVRAYDVSVRIETQLGEAITDRYGNYTIKWAGSRAAKHTADANIALKVLSPQKKTVLYSTAPDNIRFDAGHRETINVVLTKPIQPETIEFEDLTARIAVQTGKLKLTDLGETTDHRDITLLSKSLRLPTDKIQHLVVAERMAELSGVEAPFFYALLRQNTLLKNDFTKPLETRFAIDTGTDPKTVLYDTVLADPKTIEQDIAAASKAKLISGKTAAATKHHLKILTTFKAEAEAFNNEERVKRITEVVTQFVIEDKLGQAAELFKANKRDLSGVIQKIASAEFLGNMKKVREMETILAIGDLIGHDRTLVREISKAHKIKKPADVRKLARLDKKDWEAVLNKFAKHIKLGNRPLNKRLVSLHASSLVRKMEKDYPSEAFLAQLERDKKPVIDRQKDIAGILEEHDDFDLKSSNIDLFFKQKKLTAKKHQPAREELKKIQRVFRLAPNYAKATALLERNIASARDITAIGKKRFLMEVAPAAGIKPKEAKEMYLKAETTSTATMMIAGDMQDIALAEPVASFNTKKLANKVAGVSKDFPNLKTLFKGIDACACRHCRSVYGPAAYLVELLEFIDNRSVTDLTVNPHVTANAAQDVLFERRPDLAEIDLNCANAHTPVPYIDLVCEQLEKLVIPDPGIDYTGDLAKGSDPLVGAISSDLLDKLVSEGVPVTEDAQIFSTEVAGGSSSTLPHYIRDKKAVLKAVKAGGNSYKIYRLHQTLAPAEELAAAPAYVNTAAYAELAGKSFAFTLPFDLHHTEAGAYFDRFNIDRAELMRTFQTAGTPDDATIAAESLGLTAAERSLITIADPAGQPEYWNLPLADMKVVSTFLDKTGLNHEELIELLTFEFIDPDKKLFIKHEALDCNLDKEFIENLDNAALDRIHRFLRLQKVTGWKADTVDEIFSQTELGAGAVDDAALAVSAALKRLSDATGIKLDELVGCYGDFSAELYEDIFLNKAKNGDVNDALRPENIDGNGFLAGVAASLTTSLQIKDSDLTVLVTLLTDDKLTIANLSRLYLFTRLMKKAKLTAGDIDALIGLAGTDPTTSPANTLEFAEAAQTAKDLPLALADIRFMLYHQADDLEALELKDDTIQATLATLQTAYQDAFATHKSPFDPNFTALEQQEALSKLLGGFTEVTPEDAKVIAGFTDREWTSPAAAKALIDNLFAGLFDTAAIKAAIDALAALAPNADAAQESKDFMQALMDALAARQFLAAKTTILETHLSAAFKSDAELTATVLAHTMLKQPAPGTDAVRDILLSDDLIDTANPTPAPPAITEIAFGQHYQALRLLHKLLPLIASYELQASTVSWLFTHAPDLAWLEWDSIPYESGHSQVGYETYIGLARLLALAEQLAPVVNPADASRPISFWSIMEMTLPGSIATRDQFLTGLALLTGYEKTSLDEIDAHFFPAFDITQYHSPATWERLLKSAEYARKLASPISDITQFIKPVLTMAESAKLRAALKSRYDETTWLETLREIMDTIRPKKRDALVAYILATKPEFTTAYDLYDHLLIDVEMEACMPSSRIVQAHGSIQLFVQRCLMGLEPKAAANTETDSGWEQWNWLKLYRVREVNMKIWCYPENWIEAELRDDKSFIFQELENELKQNELTEFTAERALTHYLEQLDGLSFMEVVATWYQANIRTMHVFARTKTGDPPSYYHRKFEQERYWTPWEKVDLDITGDQLLAFVRNDRLSLAWPVFSEEPDPNPESTVPDSSPGTVVATEKPRRKLKIQLAVSEFADGIWQPKRLSKDAVRTPTEYTTDPLEQHLYNLIYVEWLDQITLLKAKGQDNTDVMGTFDIAGCKGYPELFSEGRHHMPDFFPDFKDTLLTVQRYREQYWYAGDDLTARTALSFGTFYTILNKTPGTFRITYPHQMTLIDLVALIIQYVLLAAYGSKTHGTAIYDRTIKWPLGTLLPYFMEDSQYAYVITPGFYKSKAVGAASESFTTANTSGEIQRTASNVLQFIEDIIALYQKYLAKLQGGQSLADVVAELTADEDYHDVVAELKVYATLKYGEKFDNMYHPLICELRKALYKEGIPALMRRQTQLRQTNFSFDSHYNPTPVVPPEHPIEDVDFASDGSYSGYNWELFFHVPMLIATQLTRNQRFEEAMQWFHYIFNPTGALDGDTPQKYWVTKPFFLRNAGEYIEQRIDTLLYKTADPNTPEIKELEFAIQQWRDKPFRPHVVARFRTVAYQKAILMKYIDNLIEWGDYLFRQDTMESIAQATQMYVMADKLLGSKPRKVSPVVTPPAETYNQIQAKLGPLGNALIDLENILPDLSALPEDGAELPPSPITLSTLYFCVPQNEQMLAYWDRIADRLFKIRNCQNIDGIERSLALFAPPIDPAMLVKAAAAGLDISSIIAGLNAPLPYYRFNALSQKAVDLANEVRTLGNSLLQALEKKDAEDLSLLRSKLEIKLQKAMTDMKKLAIDEAEEQINILKRTKAVTEERHKYYSQIQKISAKEQLNLDKLEEAHNLEKGAQISRTLAGITGLLFELIGGASGFGGSPHVTFEWGGKNLAAAANSAADVVQIFAAVAAYEANRASILGGYNRRQDDWDLQARLADKELASIKTQITAAEIRRDIAKDDLKNHELQIENAKKTDEFMRDKFTNDELYQWMIGQISSVYYSAYKLAYSYAKKAERAYQFELGHSDSFISFGYWDSRKKGLQSADNLIYDIKRMETAYLDNHKREYEVTKHISLASLDPLALAKLRATGSCDFTVPEALFDLDHAGHYFRRTKTVGMSLPCIAGPHTSVSAKLSLVSNKYRKNVNPDNLNGTGYAEDPGNDERFFYNVGAIQSIVTSNAQQDSGLFELNFRDDRYLPFEGTGAISTWRIELPNKDMAQFNYDTIADVVLHLSYTAREGGSSLRTLAETDLTDRLNAIQQELSQTGLHTTINFKHEMPNEWHLLKTNGTAEVILDNSRLPYLAQAMAATIEKVILLAKADGNPANLPIDIDTVQVNLARIDAWKTCKGETTAISLDTAFTIALTPANLGKLQDLTLVIKYGF